jgi:hypothetical protein
MTLSALRLCNIDDGIIIKCGATGGIRIDGETLVLGENLPQCN